ncbi:UDP-2,3-diacylglucosamine diphosphatase [Costertonia aggregata]|uniref:UDP-2,3-diacylglucosamine diphosphatase n=1 Tax=Costertonia aggregata TaxID=343403 RepID=A0A7H9AU60_9FLAO|nr:UDP-2,3-diacylglucosamine diphosphatase [Costertonia aggregata]QLG46989.1 UDP-2,3-diacylglucosamine diphosphatase [Costertonia aggregata]
MKKRKLEVAVISDVHLGTYECHADELITYLNSIQPAILILNGDIVDESRTAKDYFPPSHIKVLRKLLSMASKGTEMYYITGNHDATLRKFSGTSLGTMKVVDKLVLQIDGKLAWFFHGDIFDVSPQNAKRIARLGSFGYKLLITLNRFGNWLSKKRGKERFSFSKKMEKNTKRDSKYMSDFEQSAIDLAVDKGYDYVVCGHTHQPKKEEHETKNGRCLYLNSGDWVEHLTALEYSFKRWKIYKYNHDKLSPFFADEEIKEMDMKELIATILKKNKPSKDKESID